MVCWDYRPTCTVPCDLRILYSIVYGQTRINGVTSFHGYLHMFSLFLCSPRNSHSFSVHIFPLKHVILGFVSKILTTRLFANMSIGGGGSNEYGEHIFRL